MPPPVRFLLRQLEAQIEEYMLTNFPKLDPRDANSYLDDEVVQLVQKELLHGFQELMLDRMLNILPINPEMKMVYILFVNAFINKKF